MQGEDWKLLTMYLLRRLEVLEGSNGEHVRNTKTESPCAATTDSESSVVLCSILVRGEGPEAHSLYAEEVSQ